MSPPAEPEKKAAAETHLQRTLTSVVNGLPAEAALVAIFHQEQGPLTTQVHRGFTPRDVQSIVRTLSSQKVLTSVPVGNDPEASRTMRLRLSRRVPSRYWACRCATVSAPLDSW